MKNHDRMQETPIPSSVRKTDRIRLGPLTGSRFQPEKKNVGPVEDYARRGAAQLGSLLRK